MPEQSHIYANDLPAKWQTLKGTVYIFEKMLGIKTLPNRTFLMKKQYKVLLREEEVNKKRYLVVPALQVFHTPGTVDNDYSAAIFRKASFECANYFYYACLCVYKLMCKEVSHRFQCKESAEATAA